jgi:hypothetical protein
MHSYNQVKKNIKKDFSSLLPIKVAILGDSPTQYFNVALKGIG